jgi:hypothetical protein
MSEKDKFSVIPGGKESSANKKILMFRTREQADELLKEKVKNIFDNLKKIIVQSDEDSFNPQGLVFIFGEMEKLRQKMISPDSVDLASRLDYVLAAVSDVMKGKKIDYVGADEQVAASRQAILRAIELQRPE